MTPKKHVSGSKKPSKPSAAERALDMFSYQTEAVSDVETETPATRKRKSTVTGVRFERLGPKENDEYELVIERPYFMNATLVTRSEAEKILDAITNYFDAGDE